MVEVDNVTAKAMILSYNQQGSPLLDYEEAQIVYSLKKEHLMKQEEITLLSKSFPWVSRRLSFIERLDDSVRTHLQLGKITPTHARELVKLPCGKQNDFIRLVIDNNLTSRQRVKRILERNAHRREHGQGHLPKPGKRNSKLNPHKEYISELLETHKAPPMTNQRIFELLGEKGFEGRITILRNYLAQVRGKKTKEPVICIETAPVRRATYDWSDYYCQKLSS